MGLTIVPFVFELTQDAVADTELRGRRVALGPLRPCSTGALATTMPYEFEGQRISLPAHDVQGRLVWGLTHRMLETLFALLR